MTMLELAILITINLTLGVLLGRSFRVMVLALTSCFLFVETIAAMDAYQLSLSGACLIFISGNIAIQLGFLKGQFETRRNVAALA